MIIPATPPPAPRKFGIDVSKPLLLLFAEFSAVIAARPRRR
jgi:hypothetical protein